jgi:hypothetical protein
MTPENPMRADHSRRVSVSLPNPVEVLVICLALAALPAGARADTAIYGGIGVGYAGIEVDQEPLEPVNFPELSLTRDLEGSAAAVRQFLGVRLGRYLAIEGGYFRYGTIHDTAYLATPDFPVVPPFPGTDYAVKLDGYDAFLMGFWPLNQDLEVFGKVGMAWWDSRFTVHFPGADEVEKTDGSDLAWGFGLNYLTTGPFQVRLEFQMLDTEVTDLNWNVMASGIYSFRLGR